MEGKNLLAAALCVTASIAAASNARAAIVTTLFDDDFEAQTLNANPGDPASGFGTWASIGTNAKSTVVAAGAPNAASPDAGANILRVAAGSTSASRQRNFAAFEAPATGEGTVRVEFDAREESGTTTFNFGLVGNNGGAYTTGVLAPIWIQLGNGPVQAYNATGGWQAIGALTHSFGAWQHYVLEYELGSTEFTLTAGANTETSTRFFGTTPGATELSHVYFAVGQNTALAYVDNVEVTLTTVPEPATLAALGAAGVVFARRRRRA